MSVGQAKFIRRAAVALTGPVRMVPCHARHGRCTAMDGAESDGQMQHVFLEALDVLSKRDRGDKLVPLAHPVARLFPASSRATAALDELRERFTFAQYSLEAGLGLGSDPDGRQGGGAAHRAVILRLKYKPQDGLIRAAPGTLPPSLDGASASANCTLRQTGNALPGARLAPSSKPPGAKRRHSR